MRGRIGPLLPRYDLPGLWVALVLALLTFTPSLLPRPPEYQGLLVGINAAIGYGAGVVGAWLVRELTDRPRRTPQARSWRVLQVTAAVTLLPALVWGERWQRDLRELVGLDEVPAWRLVTVPVVATVVFALLLAVARLLRSVTRAVTGFLRRGMGDRPARALGVVLVVVGTVMVLSGVVRDAAVDFADGVYSLRDGGTPEGLERPSSALRSGGPGSLVAWEDLGQEGRKFTGRGPSAEEISELTDRPASEPVRAYAGIDAAEDAESRAALAVDDLERAGGFEREHLLVVTTTGTGWVEPSSTASFEYLTGGDSAIVSMQYSYLPSWLSFLVDQRRAREAGRELFDAVYGRWLARPVDDRPRLFVFGESLGSFGAETAFSGEADLRNRLDGALFTGPPNFNTLYREIVDERDPGSPEVEPVFRSGRTIRFSTAPAEGVEPSTPWEGSRVLYLQHASDPVTWWSPDLLWHRPDWLEEPRGRDVAEDMRWIPVVTFWQVSADLALCFSMPPGHGHNFTGEHVDAWASVLEPEGWDADDLARLKALIRAEPS